jgi:hypothetical protein
MEKPNGDPICSFLRDSQDRNKVGEGLTDNRTSRIACTALFHSEAMSHMRCYFFLISVLPDSLITIKKAILLFLLGSDDTTDMEPWRTYNLWPSLLKSPQSTISIDN